MHVAGINFVSFTAQIYNALYRKGKAKGDFWHFWGKGHGPLLHQSVYVLCHRSNCMQLSKYVNL